MEQSLENNFGNNAEYKALFAKQVYLFVLNQIKKEQIWSKDTEKNIAHDITMGAIAKLLERESLGNIVDGKYKYLITTVTNDLRNKKFIFNKIVRKHSSEKVKTNKYSTGDYISNDINETQTRDYNFDQENIFIMHTLTSEIPMEELLTPDEKIVSKLLNEGYIGKEIAGVLGKSESTISRIVQSLRLKLDRYKP